MIHHTPSTSVSAADLTDLLQAASAFEMVTQGMQELADAQTLQQFQDAINKCGMGELLLPPQLQGKYGSFFDNIQSTINAYMQNTTIYAWQNGNIYAMSTTEGGNNMTLWDLETASYSQTIYYGGQQGFMAGPARDDLANSIGCSPSAAALEALAAYIS